MANQDMQFQHMLQILCDCLWLFCEGDQLLLPQCTHDDHMHDSISHNCLTGWKSLMDRHKRVPVAKRPLGVSIMMAGGLKGYSGCNFVQQMNQFVISFEDRRLVHYVSELAAAILTGKRSLPIYQPPA